MGGGGAIAGVRAFVRFCVYVYGHVVCMDILKEANYDAPPTLRSQLRKCENA